MRQTALLSLNHLNITQFAHDDVRLAQLFCRVAAGNNPNHTLPRGTASLNPRGRLFDHYAVSRFHPQHPRRKKGQLRNGLTSNHVFGTDQHIQNRQPAESQVGGGGGMASQLGG